MVRLPLTKSREKAEKLEAQFNCSELIQRVESAQLGRIPCNVPFVMKFIEDAEDLGRSLEILGIPVPDELWYFCENAGHAQTLTEFGLPVYEEGFVITGLAGDLVPSWLQCMREFRDTLAAPTHKSNKPKSKRGRRTAKKTKQLYKDIFDWLAQEASSLKKNGASDAFIRERQMRFTWRDIVNGINDSCLTRQYKLDEATRRKVQRSPSWKALHGTASPAAFGEEPTEDSPMYRASDAFDLGRAVEERLRPQRAEAARTKFPAR